MNKKIKIILSFIMVLLLAGCATTESKKVTTTNNSSQKTTANSASQKTTTNIATKSSTVITTTTESKVDNGFNVTINADSHVKVYVYDTQDYSVRPESPSTTCKAKTENGVISSNVEDKPQVNLELVFDEGYELDSISATKDTYKNIKTPTDTGKENVYRFTVINSDTVITVTSKEIEESGEGEAEAEGFTVSFSTDSHVKVYVYESKDYTKTPTLVNGNTVYARTEDGVITKDQDSKPQVNILLVFDEGYELDSISATKDTYKNIKTPTDTGKDNVYRFTVINSDTVITVTSKEIQK